MLFAFRLAVLTEATLLRDTRYWHRIYCYAMPGTNIGYAATQIASVPPELGSLSKLSGTLLSYHFAMQYPGTSLLYLQVYSPMVRWNAQY